MTGPRHRGDYDRAFDYYDQAVAGGRTDADMYGIRADTRIKALQDKYGTENVQELRAQMTPDEKSNVCADSKQALDLGLERHANGHVCCTRMPLAVWDDRAGLIGNSLV